MARSRNQNKATVTGATVTGESPVMPELAVEMVPDAETVAETPAMTTAEEPDPAPAKDTTVISPARRGGGLRFLALLLGGAVAAGGGFALARFVPDGWPLAESPKLAALEQTVQQQTEALASQNAAFQAALAEIETRLKAEVPVVAPGPDLTPQLEALDERITALEARPSGTDEGVVAALRAEIEGMKTALNAPVARVQAEVEAQLATAAAQASVIRDEAAAQASATRRAAALAALRASFDGGMPLESALAGASAEGVTIPAEITIDTPTLASLQEAFPEAARAALAAARQSEAGDDALSRISTFLQAQTGARSLTPREGDGADAILSRAEAALRQGDLPAALTELAALPEVSQAPLAAWIELAQRRQSAATALSALE